MKKRFRGRKKLRMKFGFIKYIILLVVLYFGYQIVVGIIHNTKLAHNNEEFIRAMMEDSNHHLLYQQKKQTLVDQAVLFITNLDFSKPISILEKSFGKSEIILNENLEKASSEKDYEHLEGISKHIEDPFPTNVENPRIYLYNSHQTEQYSMDGLEAYNIKPSVMMASYFLKEKLNRLGVPTIAESGSVIDLLNANGWNHNDSYKASRFFIMDTLNKHKNLDLILDIHRDAITHKQATVSIDGKDYAKVMFVIGTNNLNSEGNRAITEKLDALIKKKYPGLSRGILSKGGITSNGRYNQDLNPNMTLLEVGGHESKIDEVLNTIEAISLIIKEMLEE